MKMVRLKPDTTSEGPGKAGHHVLLDSIYGFTRFF
jgi:hypothetical protein